MPKYRKHSTRNFAFVEVEGKRIRLRGDYDSAESRAHYHEVCALIERTGDAFLETEKLKKKLSVQALVAMYLDAIEPLHDGSARGDFMNCKNAARIFVSKCATADARNFGPKALKAFQADLVNTRATPPEGKPQDDMPLLSRNYINDTVRRVKAIFRWAVSEELLSPSISHGLDTVKALRKGKTMARETAKRKAVALEHVTPMLPFVPNVVQDMIHVQMLTGARSDSICNARPCEFDTTGDMWLWRPKHKTQYRGVELVLPIGPRCQGIIAPYLATHKPQQYIFSPKAVRRDSRYRKRYDTQSYGTAVRRGIRKLNLTLNQADRIPLWSPHQLRHLKGTVVNDSYGIEAAQAVLGHDTISATRIYRTARLSLAKKVARETG